MTRRTLAALAAAIAALALPAASSAAVTTQSIDGPSADISRFSDIALAPDGTGAVVYLKKMGGKDHVFVAVRTGGTWKAPTQVDIGSDMGSAPCRTDGALRARVAAANGGRVVVTYLSGAGPANFALCSNVKASSAAPFGAEALPVNANPAAQYQDVGVNAGVAYVVYTDFNFDIRAERLKPGETDWKAVGATYPNAGGVLDKTATDHSGDSGSNASGPVITVTPQGQAVIAFSSAASGDPQDMIVRRLKNASDTNTPAGTPSDYGPAQVADKAALGGAPATGSVSDMPTISSDGSGAAWVVFREFFHYTDPAPQDVPRGIAAKLTGDTIGVPVGTDGLPENATKSPINGVEFPSVALDGAGRGLLAFARQNAQPGNGANEVRASTLAGDAWSSVANFDPMPSTAPPAPSSALGGNGDGLIAWRNQISMTKSEIDVRQLTTGTFGSPTVVSNPAFGVASQNDAPAAAAAQDGTGAVGFSQGTAGTSRIVVATVTPPPGWKPGGGTKTATGVFLRAPRHRLTRTRRLRIIVRNANAFTIKGRLTVASTRRLRIGGKRRKLTLGSRRLRVAGHRRKTLRFRASPREVRALKTAGKVRVRARLRVTDPAGKVRRKHPSFVLRPARAK
jgi:hypothetical protein